MAGGANYQGWQREHVLSAMFLSRGLRHWICGKLNTYHALKGKNHNKENWHDPLLFLKHMSVQWDKPTITDELYQIARTLVRNIGSLENDEYNSTATYSRGSILIFLPGIYEIGRLYTILSDYSMWVLAIITLLLVRSLRLHLSLWIPLAARRKKTGNWLFCIRW